MYTTELQKTAKVVSTEDPVKLAAFEARVAADEFIEPKDWMPEAYRRTLTRQISPHAHSENGGRVAAAKWDFARTVASAQGDPARQGAGRSGAWALSLLRRGNARDESRADGRGAAF